MIRQQLQRHDMQDGAEFAVVFGHTNDVDAGGAFDVGVGVGKDVERAGAGAHFIHVARQA